MSAAGVLTAKSDLLRSLEGEIAALLRRVRRATDERARHVDPSLTVAGYQVLQQVRGHGGVSQVQVADALGMDKGAVSRQVHQLCDLGLVARTEDPSDRRAQVVRLSDEGERRLDELDRTRRAAYVARFDDWSAGELEALVEQLARYNRTVSGD